MSRRELQLAMVNFEINERGSNSTGCSKINSITYTPEITNIMKAPFRNSREEFRESEIVVKDDTSITSGINTCECDIIR